MEQQQTDGGAKRAVFAPVDSRARVDAVVRRIGDAIELGLLADGEQLPGETELAGQLGVSTVTLREALMALRQQGLVVTRRGRGGGGFVSL
ncbi:winged helix-turn-helix domain-containing protein, partial [Streptomyces sp. NPDC048279]|uniref:FadR/GntR family transcriptional regulator n=1 Tax=Streptomyces sp. NPDC048279 TaxID=3154714 RepID=UPI0034366C26